MKRLFCIVLALALLPIAAMADSPLPESLTLAPGEFRIVDSVRLDPDEKLNAE